MGDARMRFKIPPLRVLIVGLLAQVTLGIVLHFLAIKLPLKLIENAVLTVLDDTIADTFGVTLRGVLNFTLEWVVPFLAATIALWLFYLASRRHWEQSTKADDSRMTPNQMIVGGLVIIVIGVAFVGIGLWRQPQQPSIVVSQQPSSTASTAQKRRLNIIDYDERRRILNTFYKHVNGPIRDTYSIAWGLYNDQPRLINTNQKAVYLELKKIRQQIISEWEELIAPLVRDSDLYSDTRQMNWNFHTILLGTLNELINSMNTPIANDQTIFIDSKETDKLRAGIDTFGQWIEKTKEQIQKLRSEDDTAEIYQNLQKAP